MRPAAFRRSCVAGPAIPLRARPLNGKLVLAGLLAASWTFGNASAGHLPSAGASWNPRTVRNEICRNLRKEAFHAVSLGHREVRFGSWPYLESVCDDDMATLFGQAAQPIPRRAKARSRRTLSEPVPEPDDGWLD
jgi:hypothetical protein